jgi:hypothetical protein
MHNYEIDYTPRTPVPDRITAAQDCICAAWETSHRTPPLISARCERPTDASTPSLV